MNEKNLPVSAAAPLTVTAKDYYLGALTGLLTGLFAIPVALNVGLTNTILLVGLPLVLTPLFAFGIWLGKFLSRYLPIMFQVGKFAAVGFLNTAVNFGILNLVSLATGIASGWIVGGINVPGTIISAVNSYGWNKFWTFSTKTQEKSYKDVFSFAIVTFIGLVGNSVVVAIFTTYLAPVGGLNAGAWLNIGKVLATIISAVINFVGYKFIVFRTEADTASGISKSS